MKRKLLIAAMVLLLIIAGVAIFLYNSIDPIVKSAIERFGSDVTGTKVTVGSVDISLKTGRGTIRDLKVDNPEGFSSGDAFELGEITIDLDVASLNKDPIVIEEIRVLEPVVRGELDGKARTNIGVLRDHVLNYQDGSSKKPAQKQDGGYEKHFAIRQLFFDAGRVELDATAAGVEEEKTIDLPTLRVGGVGGERGATPAALGKAIANAFLAHSTRAVKSEVEAEAKSRLEEEAKKKLGDILGK